MKDEEGNVVKTATLYKDHINTHGFGKAFVDEIW